MRKNKLLLLLALLMTAVTGAWADETPLVTIESKNYESFKSGSQTFDDKVTVTFSKEVFNEGDAGGWYTTGTPSLLTVAGTNGYTITSCKFYTYAGDGKTGYTVKGESPSVYLNSGMVYTDANKSLMIGNPGIKKIEVYGAAAASGYTVTLKDGVKDAAKWTITPNEGLKEGDEVNIQYSGRLKVKGVKATSDAAAPSVPDGALGGVFSVSDGKQVYFSKGNLRYASSKWSFFDNQYDYYTSYSADAWDHFGWSTSAPTYGMNTSESNSDYSGDFVDWGATMGTGWFTLSQDEWTYLLNTRSASTVGGTADGRYAKAKVNDVQGIILFPDSYTHPDGVTAPTGVNDTGNTGWNENSYTVADWTKMESAGCVFLPAAGYRRGSSVRSAGTLGYYWSATPDGTNFANYVNFYSSSLIPASSSSRIVGSSVRLVQEATSDPAPAAPALSITSPSVGQVIGSDGKNYAYASLPTGVTAVAKICYVNGSNGLALAIEDEGQMNWSTAIETCAAHTPAFTGGTWKLATKDEWNNMINAAGGDIYLRQGFNSVGGTNMQQDTYWTSTEYEDDSSAAYCYDFDNLYWNADFKDSGSYYVRACLAF